MPAQLATLLCFIGIGGLWWLDRDRRVRTSRALWIPLIWLAVAGSRMPSQWMRIFGFGMEPSTSSYNPSLDGSPFDRYLLTVMLLIGVGVLAKRKRKVRAILRSNAPIICFFAYCLISTLWSDYTDVSFKRWVKGVGDLVAVLLVVTEQEPAEAVKTLMVRVGFVLIPASILLSKYYTALGRGFGEGGEGFFTGVTTSKNELGGICLLFGLGAAWRMIRFLRNKEERRKFGPVLAQSVLLLMVLWLFYKANTMTALACFTMGCIVLVAASLPWIMRRRWLLHTLILSMLVVAGSALFLGIGSGLLSTMGRDSTLTGRTAVWDVVLPLATNPLIGTGFESFWLGSRLDKIWSVYWWHPNEAHNGYIEVYLNLGWVGLVFFAVLIVTGYRTVVSMLRREPVAASFRLALLVVAIAYNFTESAVRILHPVWICFLMASLAVPGGWIQAGLTKARAVRDAVTPEVFPELELAGGEPNGFELSRLDGPQATPAPSEAGSRSSSFVLYGSKSNPGTRD